MLGPDDIRSRNAWHTMPCVVFHYKLTLACRQTDTVVVLVVQVGMHLIQNFAVWLDPDPEMSDPAGYGSKPRPLLTTGKKLLLLHHNWKSWNDCLRCSVTELLLE